MSEEEKVIAILKKVLEKYVIKAPQRQCKQIRWAIDLAIRIIEKQVPKKLNCYGCDDDYYFECSACDEEIEEDCGWNYCPDCGQKIDWRVSDE